MNCVQKCALDKLDCVTGGGGNVGGFFSVTIPIPRTQMCVEIIYNDYNVLIISNK